MRTPDKEGETGMRVGTQSQNKRRRRAWLASACIAAMMPAGQLLAQEQTGAEHEAAEESSPSERILVTGTRIQRAGFDTLQSAVVVDDEEIRLRAYTNIGEALEAEPGFGPSASSPVGASQSTLGVAQTFVNFFGLGSQRTLTLVNGRRHVSSNTASGSGAAASPGSQVDLNLIPAGLVARVETVAIGGAPVYGADAIAGTVNVILRDDFEGVQGTLQYGISDRGDAESRTYRLLMGGNFADNRGNAVLSLEHNTSEGLPLSGRMPFRFLVPNPADTGPNDGIPAQMVVDDLRYSVLTAGGLPYNPLMTPLLGFDLPGIVFPPIHNSPNYITDANGTPLQFGPNGELVPFSAGTVVQAALGAPVLSAGGDGLSPADHFSLLSPTERTLLNAMAHFDFTPAIRGFVETSYSRSEGIELSELYQFAAPGALGGPQLTFSATNPFLSSDAQATLAANGLSEFAMNRNLNDLADLTPGRTTIDVFRFVGGFMGDLPVGWDTLQWDVSYNYGRSESYSQLSYIDPTRLALAIDAVTDANGQIVCASGGSCVPLNLFGVSNFSRAAADYVTDIGRSRSFNTQEVVTANLSGDLPFGIAEPVGFNVGAEYRRETALFEPDATMQAGILLLGPGVNAFAGVEGSFDTREVYGEFLVPLVTDSQNLPLIRDLSFEAAVRYVDNSIAGGDTTWSAGGRLSPRWGVWSDGLVLRGVYTRAIRAPAITELFLGSAPVASGIADPCSMNNYNQGQNPSVRAANCAAALSAVGAPAPENFQHTTGTVSAFGTVSGNQALNNEVADSWSVGFVYQPAWLSGFRMAVDWSDISIEDGIQTLGIGSLLQACYDSTNYPNESACSAFTRLTAAEAAAQPGALRVAGDIANGFQSGYYNTSSLRFNGLIAAAQYGFDLDSLLSGVTDPGRITLGARLFYSNRYELQALPGSPSVNQVGTVGNPRYTGNFSVGYSRGPLDANVQMLWQSAVKLDPLATIEQTPINRIGDYTLFNGTIGYNITERLRAQLAVRNLLDTDVPYEAQVTRSFRSYDPLGRRYFLTLTASF